MDERADRLSELAEKYGTDKGPSGHGFTPVYDKIIREVTHPNLVKKVLEIGVLRGESVQMWREYFPNAEIHGVELVMDRIKIEDMDRIVIHEGNACHPDVIDEVSKHGPFDIIIDDGSHFISHQQLTLRAFMSQAKFLYIIEDLHSSLYNIEEIRVMFNTQDYTRFGSHGATDPFNTLQLLLRVKTAIEFPWYKPMGSPFFDDNDMAKIIDLYESVDLFSTWNHESEKSYHGGSLTCVMKRSRTV